MADDHIPVVAGGLTLPPDVQNALLHIIDDIVPPRFPEGCELILQRPGQVEIVVRITIPVGCMLAMVPPVAAANIRPQIKQAQAANQAAMERQATIDRRARNGLG